MVIDVCGKKLKLSAASFFQLNTFQAERMVNKVAELVEPCGTLVEAYCGVGLMSIAASDKFEKGIGIEVVKEAIINAKENARINRLKHLSFVCGDAAKELKKIAQNEKIDALIVDPPRSGLDEPMLKAIMQCLPTQIVYVSCNPATLSKNLAVLTSKYDVELIQPLDMFPQTPHVECIVKLKIK
jgi:23S rRNA (uracil-5-)-methyltransferase RumA